MFWYYRVKTLQKNGFSAPLFDIQCMQWNFIPTLQELLVKNLVFFQPQPPGKQTPWKFNSSPLNIYRDPKGKYRLPTIIFQGLYMLNFGKASSLNSFRSCSIWLRIHQLRFGSKTQGTLEGRTKDGTRWVAGWIKCNLRSWARRQLFWVLRNDDPQSYRIHVIMVSMGYGIGIPTWMVDFLWFSCREIYHTFIDCLGHGLGPGDISSLGCRVGTPTKTRPGGPIFCGLNPGWNFTKKFGGHCWWENKFLEWRLAWGQISFCFFPIIHIFSHVTLCCLCHYAYTYIYK